jgi:hypothetical protein
METKGLRAKRFPYPAPWGGTFLIWLTKKINKNEDQNIF